MTPTPHPALAVGAAWLLTYLVHSTLLLGGAWLLAGRLVRSDAWKETLWKLALVGGVCTATMQVAVGYRPVAGRMELPWAGRTALDAGDPRAAAPIVGDATGGPGPVRDAAGAQAVRDAAGSPAATRDAAMRDAAVRDAAGSPAQTWQVLLLAVWLFAALGLLVRLALRHRRLHRLLRDRQQVASGGLSAVLAELRRNAGIWRPVWLTASPRCPSPLALGLREICVPERFVTELDDDQQRGALAHELAHIARRDPFWHLVAGVVESLFCLQPLNRVARLRLREAAENLCDDWAARQTGSRVGLARCLAEVASWVAPGVEAVPAGTMAMAEGGSPLLMRVQRLLDGGAERGRVLSPALRGFAATAALTVVAGAAPSVVPAPDPAGRVGAGPGEGEAAAPITRAPRDSIRIVRAPPDLTSLEARWSWAESAAAASGDRAHWIAYAIPSLVPAGEITTSDSDGWSSSELEGEPLAEMLGVEADLLNVIPPGRSAVVVLFQLRNPRGGPVRIDRIALRGAASGMRWDGDPVYWLGVLPARSSLAWLCDLFERLQGTELPSTVLEAIAVHPGSGVFGFLRQVIEDERADRVRRSAVEGLEWRPTDETLALLERVARQDPSEAVRRQADEAIDRIADRLGSDLDPDPNPNPNSNPNPDPDPGVDPDPDFDPDAPGGFHIGHELWNIDLGNFDPGNVDPGNVDPGNVRPRGVRPHDVNPDEA